MRTAADERSPGLVGRMPRWTPMAWAAVVLLATYWSIAILVLAIDPYDVYPWGWRSELPAADTPDNSMFLLKAAAKRPEIDVVMIGSSASTSYTPEQVRSITPGARHGWNASYPAARPADRALAIDLFMEHSHASRFILWLDWIYILPAGKEQDRFPTYLYDSSHLNDLQMVNQEAVSTIWRLLHGAGIFEKGQLVAKQDEAIETVNFKAFQTPAAMHGVESLIRSKRREFGGPWRSSCSRYPTVDLQLVPELKKLSERHIRVDLVFPAYSAAAYYFAAFRGFGPTLGEQLNFRRCVVMAASSIPGVAIWAPDVDTGTITDLANYWNPAHLYGKEPLMKVLGRIGDPAYRIDSNNVEPYLERLRATVLGYDVKNSTLGIGGHDGS